MICNRTRSATLVLAALAAAFTLNAPAHATLISTAAFSPCDAVVSDVAVLHPVVDIDDESTVSLAGLENATDGQHVLAAHTEIDWFISRDENPLRIDSWLRDTMPCETVQATDDWSMIPARTLYRRDWNNSMDDSNFAEWAARLKRQCWVQIAAEQDAALISIVPLVDGEPILIKYY